MIVSPHPQGSVDWMLARAGIPTASEFGNLVSDTFEVRKGEMPKTYVAKKLAEAWLGGPLAEFNTFDMDQGKILEEEALPWYEFETGTKVRRVGLITTDDGRVGCSPDGLADVELQPGEPPTGIEIKCPRVDTHIRYLLNGGMPKEYGPQVHGSMYVTGAQWWEFVSYSRKLPKIHLPIGRDEKIQRAVGEALAAFLAAFDSGWARLCEMNDGPPKRKTVTPLHPPPMQNHVELTYLQ